MGKTQVLEWFAKFKSDVASVEDAKYSGGPLMSKTHKSVEGEKELVLEYGSIIANEVANMLRI
jgi:hypothetical protein